MRTPTFARLLLLGLLAAGPTLGQGFKFSQPDEADRIEEEARQNRIADQLSTPCRADLKGKKIMLVIAQVQANGFVMAQQQNYGPEFQAINSRLRAMGLQTFTPEEIRRQIAQAEIDAYFKNDPDAALAASRRLGASFILRGLITQQASMNPMMAVNQVSINMGFTLTGSNGLVLSNVDASSSSYSGADTQHMALTLINEKADEVVAQLYSDYCSKAGFGSGARPRSK